MLIKLPSWLEPLKRNLLNLLKPQQQRNNDNIVEAETSQTLTQDVGHSNLYIRLIYIICIIFFLLFLVNLFLNIRLTNLKKEIDTVYTRVSSYSSLETDYVSIAKSLNTYESLKNSKALLFPKVSLIYSNIPPSVTLDTLLITSNSFRVVLEDENPLVFSQVFSQYLTSPLIDHITLNTADLNSSTKRYIVELEGFYK